MTYASLIAAAELNWNGDADENGTGDPNDNTANGNDGTWTGTAAYGTAPYGAGKSFSLDGSSFVRIVYGSASGNRCLSCWFKAPTARAQTIICFAGGSSFRLEFNTLAGGELEVGIGTVRTTIVGSNVCDNEWHHVALVLDSETRFYLDGVLVHTGATTGAFGSTAEFTVGNRHSTNSNNIFLGEVYDAILEVGDAWSAGDISDLYAEGTTPADETAPTLTGVVATADEITFSCDENVTADGTPTIVAATGLTLTYSSGNGTPDIVFTTSRTIGYSESLLANIALGDFSDAAGNDIAASSNVLVTNQSLSGASTSGSVFSSGIKTGGQL